MISHPDRPAIPKNAFTLIELLVVLTLVLVLSGITFVAIGKVRLKSAEAQSSRNLKTMAQGLASYVVDYNGKLPESANYVTIPSGWAQMWYNGLAYYIEGPGYFPEGPKRLEVPKWLSCPARPFQPTELGLQNGVSISVGYGWNFQFFGYAKNTTSPELNKGYGSRMVDVEQPSQTIIIGTNREFIQGAKVSGSDAKNMLLYWNAPDSIRFMGAGLYLFLDGHVEKLTPKEAGRDGGYLFKRAKTATGF